MLSKLLKRKRLSKAESIFLHSHVNGAEYYGDRLAMNQWSWPEGTWLQARLERIRGERHVIELTPAQVVSISQGNRRAKR